jgi:uncharacterized DUF497 family protein
MYTINTRFEWDGSKAESNFARHGISLSEAAAIFDDPNALTRDDIVHSKVEQRTQVIGCAERGVIAVVYTRRGNRIRLISARFASRRERKFYASAQR